MNSESVMKLIFMLFIMFPLIACNYNLNEKPSSYARTSISEFPEEAIISKMPENSKEETEWDKDSPFGRAIERAVTTLYRVYNDPEYKSMSYLPGLADYNLDGTPELFVGGLGGNRGALYLVFDIGEEEYHFLGEYWVASGGQRFSIAVDQETGEKFLVATSETRVDFDSIFSSTFFDCRNEEFNIWSLRQTLTLNDNGKAYGLWDEFFFNNSEITTPHVIEEANVMWFEKNWLQDSRTPAVEMKFEDWDWHCLEDLEITKAPIYSLARA